MKRIFIASLFFLFLTIIYFFPLVKNINNLIVDDYDGLLITWSLNRVAKELPETIITRGFSWPEFFFNGNIFYPYFRSHAYSDAFITDGLMAAPFLRLFSEPIAAFNINILLGQWLFLFFTFLLLSEISGNYFLSVLLAAAFGFSNIRFQYCLLYTSDAADDLLCVSLGGRRIIKKKKLLKRHTDNEMHM